MTGPYAGSIISHILTPSAGYYVDWFKGMADIAADLGAPAIGTQFGIFTFRDYDDPIRRESLMRIALDCWREVAEHAKARGISYLFWEPMSVGRELGHTIKYCQELQNWINAASFPSLEAMVDIDRRRDLAQAEYRPLCLGKKFCNQSTIIHIKQSTMTRVAMAFTAQYNRMAESLRKNFWRQSRLRRHRP